MSEYVQVTPSVRLWVQRIGEPTHTPLVLVMGADADARRWPTTLVQALSARHLVVRFDHRDTGRSSAGGCYDAVRLAQDVVAILDGLGIDRAHVLGMSLGGLLVQLLLLDWPERLISSTVLCSGPLPCSAVHRDEALRRVDPRLRAVWRRLDTAADDNARAPLLLEQLRILNGRTLPFDERLYRGMAARQISAATDGPRADRPHIRAACTVPTRGAELIRVRTPTLVLEATDDPVNPPAEARALCQAIPPARLEQVPGMGHLLHPAVLGQLAGLVLQHTARAEAMSAFEEQANKESR
ncbi:MAG: alpha/beta fold hydrolase [Pseudonocardiaceae bacterium]